MPPTRNRLGAEEEDGNRAPHTRCTATERNLESLTEIETETLGVF